MGRSLVVVLLCASEAWAQSPRAGGPVPGDSDGETRAAVEANIAGNLARGFVDRDLIAARGILQGWTGPWGLYIQPYWLYGRVGTPMGKITTDNELYLRIGFFRKLSAATFIYSVSATDRSLRRKIDYRELLGAGAGVYFFQTKATSLHTSVGVLGEVASFKDRTLEDPDGPGLFEAEKRRYTARWSVRLYGRYRLGNGKLAVTHDVILVPSWTDPRDDYRLLFFGGIDAPIAKGFSVRVQADATYEGLIVAGTKHGDLAVTFGVSYKNEWVRKQPSTTSPLAAPPKP